MINQGLVNSIHSLLDKGVTCCFSPDPKPGNMCLEQVISYALGEEIGDKPSCVGKQVRKFVIYLNDANWSSPSARAEGMKQLAIAQLGSDSLNQDEFREKLIFAVITKLLPAMFRDLGEEKWKKEIKSLEGAKDLKEATEAAAAASVAAYATADADVAADVVSTVYAFSSAASDAALYATYATNTGDKYFKMVAHLAVEVLKDMGSPGCQFI